MITEFTDCLEFKRLVEEQQIKPRRVKAFLKERGIVLFNSNASDVATAIYTLFLGSADITLLQELIHTDKNYQKSTMLLVGPIEKDQTQDDLKDVLLEEVNRYKTISSKEYKLEDVREDTEGNANIVFSYEKRITGKMKLMSRQKKIVNVHIDKVPDSNKLRIDIRQSDSSDAKEFIAFIESIQKPLNTDADLFSINHVTLDGLDQQNKIEFYDAVSKYKLQNWKLDTITGVTVKKHNFEGEDDDEYEAETDSTGTLAGISSAILKGNGLRTNEFVQSCLNEGFIITSMKFKYSHKTEAISIVIDINFKNTDIRIDIDKSYATEDDGKEYLCPLESNIQDLVIREFQHATYDIYKKLSEKQKAKAKILKVERV